MVECNSGNVNFITFQWSTKGLFSKNTKNVNMSLFFSFFKNKLSLLFFASYKTVSAHQPALYHKTYVLGFYYNLCPDVLTTNRVIEASVTALYIFEKTKVNRLFTY